MVQWERGRLGVSWAVVWQTLFADENVVRSLKRFRPTVTFSTSLLCPLEGSFVLCSNFFFLFYTLVFFQQVGLLAEQPRFFLIYKQMVTHKPLFLLLLEKEKKGDRYT